MDASGGDVHHNSRSILTSFVCVCLHACRSHDIRNFVFRIFHCHCSVVSTLCMRLIAHWQLLLARKCLHTLHACIHARNLFSVLNCYDKNAPRHAYKCFAYLINNQMHNLFWILNEPRKMIWIFGWAAPVRFRCCRLCGAQPWTHSFHGQSRT